MCRPTGKRKRSLYRHMYNSEVLPCSFPGTGDSTWRFGREIRCRLFLKHSASAIETCFDCRGAGSQCMRRRFGAKVLDGVRNRTTSW